MGRGKREAEDFGTLDLTADRMDDREALLANCLQAEAIAGDCGDVNKQMRSDLKNDVKRV